MVLTSSKITLSNIFSHLLVTLRQVGVAPIARILPRFLSPTFFTTLRLVVLPVLLLLLFAHAYRAAFCLYLLAAYTDALDGEIARQRNLSSSFGALYDPAVDKAFHLALFFFFVHEFPILWFSIAADIVLFLVGALALFSPTEPRGAHISGKWKMVLQTYGVCMIFFSSLRTNFIFSFSIDILFAAAFVCACISFVVLVRTITYVLQKRRA